MTSRQKINANILRALLAADCVPMPDSALISAAQSMTFPYPTVAEVRSCGQELELDGLIAGASNKITGVSWTLTTAGIHQAQQL